MPTCLTISRFDHVFMAALCLSVIAPIWSVQHIPAADLPNHTAISTVVWQLVSGHGPAVPFYTLNVQPTPYYLAYLLMVPLVGLCGAAVGSKLFLSILAMATCISCTRLLRALGASYYSCLGSLFVFYGPIFYWGFISSLTALPCLFFGAVSLLRWHHHKLRRDAYAAMAWGICTCLAHIVMLVPYGVFCAALVAIDARRNLRMAFGTIAASCLPLAPWLGRAILGFKSAAPPQAQFETVHTLWHHVKLHFAVFDHSLGRAAHLTFILLVMLRVLLATVSRDADGTKMSAPSAAQRRFIHCAFCGFILLACAMPVSAIVGGSEAWGINFRYFALVEVMGLSWLSIEMATPWRPWRWALVGCTGLFMVAMVGFWHRFNAAAQPFDAILAAMHPGQVAQVQVQPGRFERAWPPLLLHLTTQYVALGGGYQNNVFTGAHIPIQQGVNVARMPSTKGCHLTRACSRYLIIQASGDDVSQGPPDMTLVRRAGIWQLYAESLCPMVTGIPSLSDP